MKKNVAPSSFSTPSLVLGVISACAVGILPLSIPSGILAVVLGAISIAKKQAGRSLAVLGIAAGVIGLVISIIFIVLGIHGSVTINIEYMK